MNVRKQVAILGFSLIRFWGFSFLSILFFVLRAGEERVGAEMGAGLHNLWKLNLEIFTAKKT